VNPPDPNRLYDLLADQALQGLDAADAAELELLLSRSPAVDADELARAAACLDRALADPAPEPLPPALRQRVQRDLTRLAHAGPPPATPPLTYARRPVRRWVRPAVAWSGWAAAALVAVGAWLLTSPPRGTEATTPGEGQQEATANPELAGVCRTFGTAAVAAASRPSVPAWDLARLARQPGTVKAEGKKPDADVVVGEVVWNTERQEGFLRLTGVPKNDPAKAQYQVWLFDADRDGPEPVDGGVFDVPGGGEVIVAIRPKLPVRKPVVVAVTREKPGGVVVSKKDQIVLLAKMGT